MAHSLLMSVHSGQVRRIGWHPRIGRRNVGVKALVELLQRRLCARRRWRRWCRWNL
jgi:hypothetical protein